jgi:Flp pilus assembly secretin CpaC
LACAQDSVPDDGPPAADQVTTDKALLKQKLDELHTLRDEVDRLREATGTATQLVLVHVRIFEASRTKFKAAGIELGDGGVVGLLADGESKPAPGEAPLPFRITTLGSDSQHDTILSEWRQLGLVKLLAEPKLTTVTDRPISFNIGSEFPILVPQSLGTVSIQYRKVGTQLDMSPRVLDDGQVRLELRPRLSRIDPDRTVRIQGVEVPGVHVREFDAGTELAPGQTLLAGGMTEHRQQANWNDDEIGTMAEIETLILATVELRETPLIAGASKSSRVQQTKASSPDASAGTTRSPSRLRQ